MKIYEEIDPLMRDQLKLVILEFSKIEMKVNTIIDNQMALREEQLAQKIWSEQVDAKLKELIGNKGK